MISSVKNFTETLATSSNFLKGLAIIGIIFYHYFRSINHITYDIQWIFSPEFLENLPNLLLAGRPVETLLFYFGYLGVTVFFILSGWGLAYSTLNKKPISLKPWEFYKKRLSRLLPLYYFSLIFCYFFYVALGTDALPREYIAKNLLIKSIFLQNYFLDTMATLNAPYWFVGTLIFLYLLFPFIFKYIMAKPWTTTGLCLLIAYLSTTALQITTPNQYFHQYLSMGGFPLTKLGEFTIGIFIAIYTYQNQDQVNQWFKRPEAIAIAITTFILGLASYNYQLLYPLHPLLIVLPLIFLVLRLIPTQSIIFKPISYAGLYSYGIFLFHRPFIEIWLLIFGWFPQRLLWATAYTVLAILIFANLEKYFNWVYKKISL